MSDLLFLLRWMMRAPGCYLNISRRYMTKRWTVSVETAAGMSLRTASGATPLRTLRNLSRAIQEAEA